jgi:hypothetical protein
MRVVAQNREISMPSFGTGFTKKGAKPPPWIIIVLIAALVILVVLLIVRHA